MVNMKQNYIKKIVKYFDSVVLKTIFKITNKTNNFFSKDSKISNKQNYIKKIVKYFDSLVLKTVFKITNKTNNFFSKDSKISNFNKLVITFISVLFIYLFYLSIPTLYDKTWIQNTIEDKLLEDFKIDFSTSSNISYYILPTPHFLIEDTKIFRKDLGKPRQLSEIKKLKVFISQKNFFNKNNIHIKRITIKNANFLLKGNDLKYLQKLNNQKFSTKKIKIINSNIFFKDNSNETVALVKVPKTSFFYDDLKLSNIFDLDGEIFKVPFIFRSKKNFSSLKNQELKIESKKLKLNFFNDSVKKT